MLKDLIKEAEKLAYSDAKEFGSPPLLVINLANRMGQRLAEKMGADKEIVLAGTLLMDSQLGSAIHQKRPDEHIEMAMERAQELFNKFPQVDKDVQEKIIGCIKDHHGAKKFQSLESEVCCNADCYKFLSVEGVIGAIHDFRKSSVQELVTILSQKAEEKWNVLSIPSSKKELEPQYRAIREFFSSF